MTTTFTVQGTTRFPFDMLRYDRCWPVNGETVTCLEDIADNGGYLPRNSDGSLRVMTFRTDKVGGPEIGRWSSFLWGCEVID